MIKLNNSIIDKGRSKNGGWSRPQLQLLGINWPPQKGWKGKIVDRYYDNKVIEKFLKLKNKHIKGEV